MKTYLLAPGINAIAAAKSGSTTVQLGSFQVGTSSSFEPNIYQQIVPEGTTVFTGGTPEMTVVHNHLSEAVVKCTVPHTAGDYLFGNVVLFLTDGKPFSVSVMSYEHEKQKTYGVCPGGWVEFQIMFRATGLMTFMNFSNLTIDPADMNTAPTELVIPKSYDNVSPWTVAQALTVNLRLGMAYALNDTVYAVPFFEKTAEIIADNYFDFDGGTDGTGPRHYAYP